LLPNETIAKINEALQKNRFWAETAVMNRGRWQSVKKPKHNWFWSIASSISSNVDKDRCTHCAAQSSQASAKPRALTEVASESLYKKEMQPN